ncbi:type IV pilus secretin PilQ, partial [Francisellaceae bacterium]|nr:type IV pilus secretin PilQ [Francisellaceae bacterium]
DTLVLTKQTGSILQYTFESLFPKKQNVDENAKEDKDPVILGKIKDITFRQNNEGNGVFTIKLPKGNYSINSYAKSSNEVVLKFNNLHISDDWAHVMNVTSFGTPVNYITGDNGFAYSSFSFKTKKPINYSEDRTGDEYSLTLSPRVKSGLNFHTNKKITLNLQDISVRSALQILANFANINLVISDQISGSVTLRLKDIPWQEALDIILVSESLGKREIGSVIYIAPASEITAHEQAELAARNAVEASEPLVVAYKELNYAKAADLMPIIQSSGAGFLGARGSISSDTRTNTLIIQDTQESVNKVLKVIDRLDAPTKEVLVHARVVEISRIALEEIGFRFLVNGANGIPITAGNKIQGQVRQGSGTLYQTPSGTSIPETVFTQGGSALGLSFTRIFETVDLGMELSALEQLNKAKSLSNPRLVVADNLTASIIQGEDVPYLQSTASGAASIAFVQAALELLVTPQISPNNTITLDVTVKKDEPTEDPVTAGVPGILTRQIQTKLVVNDGETVVLGGVYEKKLDTANQQVPLLGDIPLLGWLFRYKRNRVENRELLIFLTTTILD